MRYGIVALEVVAIISCYLMLNLPVVAAVSINIYYRDGTKVETTSLQPDGDIARTVAANSAANTVSVNVSGKTAKQISRVVIYKCRGLDPAACISSATPESFSGGAQKTYQWSELADRTTGYPQTGKLLVLVEVAGATSEWQGFYYKIYKSDQFGFDPVVPQDLAGADVYAEAGMAAQVKSFIESKNMIPFNANWVARVVLSGATGFHEIFSSSPPAGMQAEANASNTITEAGADFAFVFPSSASGFLNALALTINPSYTCGNGVCELAAGESSSNCCYDCSCPYGQYCDTGIKQCRSEGMANLALVGQQQTMISNCNVEHTITIHAKIEGAPNGMHVTGQSYRLASQAARPTACTLSGSVYSCTIAVPADPSCGGAAYTLGPNSLSFSITYDNGTQTASKTIATSFPDVTVGSWACGNGACQAGLGEDESTCCYDCPCAGAGRYCDFATGNYTSARCMQPLTSNNLQVSSVRPVHFFTHSAGNSISFLSQITSKPRGLSAAVTPGCSMDCVTQGGASCTASCSGIACSQVQSSSPNIYNSTCTMGFSISNYNATRSYSLYPAINYTITYNNGSAVQITKTLRNAFATISIGAHWCGDGTCNPDETSAGCCYDCSCQSGQYCDTKDKNYHTQGDACRLLSPIGMSIDGFSKTQFVDSMFQHNTLTTVYVSAAPSGAELLPSCSFAAGNVGCYASCSAVNDTGGAFCNITVPPIYYKTSPYYDSTAKIITLPGNRLNISLQFNNGSRLVGRVFMFGMPDIKITPTFHCGNGVCETDLVENDQSCCIDCACPGADMYCYTGVSLAGQCLNASDLNLVIARTNPARPNCTIQYYRGKCQFIRPVEIYAVVPGAPDDIYVMGSFYRFDNATYDINCVAAPFDQNENYTCSAALPEISGENGGLIGKDFGLTFTVTYTLNGTTKTQNITASMPNWTLNRVKSDRVMECEKVMKDLESKKKDLESKKGMLNIFLGMAAALAAVMCTLAAISDGGWIVLCGIALVVLGCIGGMLQGAVDKLQGEVDNLKQQRESLCASSDPSDMKKALKDSKGSGSSGLSTVLGIICAIGIIVSLYGIGQVIGPAAAPVGGEAAPGMMEGMTAAEAGLELEEAPFVLANPTGGWI